VVDYLQLVTANDTGRIDNRVQEVTQITQGLKALAKELSVPVIAVAQLSRQVENREDKKPQLADLRESGSIEQDADVVMSSTGRPITSAAPSPRKAAPSTSPGRKSSIRSGTWPSDHRQTAPRSNRRRPPALQRGSHQVQQPRSRRQVRPALVVNG